jgi:hypothetical protein
VFQDEGGNFSFLNKTFSLKQFFAKSFLGDFIEARWN